MNENEILQNLTLDAGFLTEVMNYIDHKSRGKVYGRVTFRELCKAFGHEQIGKAVHCTGKTTQHWKNGYVAWPVDKAAQVAFMFPDLDWRNTLLAIGRRRVRLGRSFIPDSWIKQYPEFMVGDEGWTEEELAIHLASGKPVKPVKAQPREPWQPKEQR